MKYIGYHGPGTLPIRPGMTVTIPKGTTVKSMHPKRNSFVLKRAQKVKVDHILPGSDAWDNYVATNPKIRWPGSGGYWNEVDINDIPEAA